MKRWRTETIGKIHKHLETIQSPQEPQLTSYTDKQLNAVCRINGVKIQPVADKKKI